MTGSDGARGLQEDVLHGLQSGASVAARAALPSWPRLMHEKLAAAYLSICATTLREKGPEPKRCGRRVLYDIRALDRWADELDGQPLDGADEAAAQADVERRFLERLNARG
jgi:hypothetical protein